MTRRLSFPGAAIFCMPLRYANRIKPSARFQDFYDHIL